MKITACCTINNRTHEVLAEVFDSMIDQEHDEFVIVLDRTSDEITQFCHDYWKPTPDRNKVKFVEIEGPPGWLSPVNAWNTGFNSIQADTGDQALYCFSSETVQAPGNIARAKELLLHNEAAIHGKAECSCGPEGTEVNWGGTAPGNLLSDSEHPRPLGFIWAAPIENIQAMDGYDREFSKGFWYDDADFFLRLWKTGLNFLFDDQIHGTHLHHDRPDLETPKGQAGIQLNHDYMMRKHGLTNPWGNLLRIEDKKPGQTIWKHSTWRDV